MNPEQSAISTFTADTLRAALAAVREALGPEALIVSQEQIGQRFRVQATLDAGEAAITAAIASAASPEGAVAGRGTVHAAQPRGEDLLADAPPVPEPVALDLVPQTFVYAGVDVTQLTGCFRFVGGSGVGKTTTLIKVLAEWVMHNGNGGAVVISTDDQKLAGAEPLQLACQMLGVENHQCNAAELEPLLARLRLNELVLIDTPASETTRSVTGNGVNVDTKPSTPVAVRDVLVCSAQHSAVALRAQSRHLHGCARGWTALTHLDQPFDAHDLVRWLEGAQISLAWLAGSQAVADNLERATPSLLGALLASRAGTDQTATEQAAASRDNSPHGRVNVVAVNV